MKTYAPERMQNAHKRSYNPQNNGSMFSPPVTDNQALIQFMSQQNSGAEMSSSASAGSDPDLLNKIKSRGGFQDNSASPAAKPKQTSDTGIPAQMQQKFEERSGFSYDDVKVHYNSDKPAELGALAYTQGNQVYIAPGQEEHLEHELGHVAQQKAGVVRATGSVGNVAVNTDMNLENGADNSSIQIGDAESKVSNSGIVQFGKTKKKSNRPVFDAKVKKACNLQKGQHRRHIVMSSIMCKAVDRIISDANGDKQKTKIVVKLADELSEISGLNKSKVNRLKKTGNKDINLAKEIIQYILFNNPQNLVVDKGKNNSSIGVQASQLGKKIESGGYDDLYANYNKDYKGFIKKMMSGCWVEKELTENILTGVFPKPCNNVQEKSAPIWFRGRINDIYFNYAFDIQTKKRAPNRIEKLIPFHEDFMNVNTINDFKPVAKSFVCQGTSGDGYDYNKINDVSP